MGFACLRLDGEFFATFDHRDRALVVMLDEQRVDQLLTTGQAWATIPAGAAERRDDILHDALAAVAHSRPSDKPCTSKLEGMQTRGLRVSIVVGFLAATATLFFTVPLPRRSADSADDPL